jgi:D-glycero-D-manno-heptose 1,7-bisphosphate phosphatase
VVNVDGGYVHRVQDFTFTPGALAACRLLASAGFALVIVTNQAGIARGMYAIEDFRLLSEWMAARFAEVGAPLDGIYFCPHHPDGTVPKWSGPCLCRKPEAGMILAAATDLRIDLARSVLIGDKWSDISAGISGGIGCCLMVRPRRESINSGQGLPSDEGVLADHEVDDLAEAAIYILDKRVGHS